MKTAAVIGAGPAGLMAAEELARSGALVTIYDAMPSVGRKFLMAGKSGLNLTKNEPLDVFLSAFDPIDPILQSALVDFGPEAVVEFAKGLGQEVFTGTSGRVFPKAMKASPMLRAWMTRLAEWRVTVAPRHKWRGWDGSGLVFDTPDGPKSISSDVTVLALGGASWSRLGSDGAWAELFKKETTEFKPANMGFIVDWSNHMEPHFGAPVKSCSLIAGPKSVRSEFVISKRGLEGGGVYAVSGVMREGAQLYLDLTPGWTEAEVAVRLSKPRGKASLSNHLRKALRLDPVRLALLNEFGRPLPQDLAGLVKKLPIKVQGPRPINEAISTAGGLRFDALTEGLMLRDKPGVFCAGEMLDWEAPTGGYLITGCLATGRHAGRSAAAY